MGIFGIIVFILLAAAQDDKKQKEKELEYYFQTRNGSQCHKETWYAYQCFKREICDQYVEYMKKNHWEYELEHPELSFDEGSAHLTATKKKYGEEYLGGRSVAEYCVGKARLQMLAEGYCPTNTIGMYPYNWKYMDGSEYDPYKDMDYNTLAFYLDSVVDERSAKSIDICCCVKLARNNRFYTHEEYGDGTPKFTGSPEYQQYKNYACDPANPEPGTTEDPRTDEDS